MTLTRLSDLPQAAQDMELLREILYLMMLFM
jgi:hypothetical protein